LRTPLVLALLVASALPATSQVRTDPPGVVRSLPGIVIGGPSVKKVEPFPVSAETEKFLSSLGWKVEPDGGLSRIASDDSSRIDPVVIVAGGLTWRAGDLAYIGTPFPLEKEKTAAYLEGLANFNQVAGMDPAMAGVALAGWGLPPSHDGSQFLNPDGSATYEGLMLYQYFVAHPSAMKRMSSERLSQSVALFDSGWDYTFGKAAAAHTGHADVKRAWSLLDLPARPGETRLALKAYPDLGKSLAKYKAMLKFSIANAKNSEDPTVLARRRTDAQALATLNALEKQRYGRPLPRPEPPPDPTEPAASGIAKPDRPEPYVSLSAGLPTVLKVLDRINGRPLTAAQQESLIRSFPMGDLVWRTGVQNLWKQGLTGQGVKVAVIDQGVGSHPELNAAVKSREKFGDYPGQEMLGPHAMHVSGIIHQLAPDAEIRSYAVLPSRGRDPRFEDAVDGAIISAIHKAVADGNTIINMSLGGPSDPNEPMVKVIEEYAKKGVIFVISAGNNRDSGIASPSIAKGAVTVGSLDANGRMSIFSQSGEVYDARRVAYAIKDVFMAPGGNINSTVPGRSGTAAYGVMSGTSMAAPAVSGMTALLKQAASFSAVPDPVTAARNILDALRSGSTPMSLRTLPPDIPLDQDFVVVDPLAALKKLDSQQDSVARR